ncbi:MAG: hypothetical protein KDK27_03145 [Leptospiraceae bacterium]|nr:hypothetical protein [Leptospiraceae bacterium]
MLECFTAGSHRDAARQRAQAAIAANPDVPGDAALSAVLDIEDDRLLQGTKGCQSALEEYALVQKSRPHAGGYNL